MSEHGKLIVVGAMKCGTSSLFRLLSAHPEIETAACKELNFLHPVSFNGEDASCFERNFSGNSEARYLCEVSPAYTVFPYGKDITDTMVEQMPEAHVVYLVRNPFERLESHYWHVIRSGLTRRSYRETVFGNPRYLGTCRYGYYCSLYKERYGDRFHVMTFDALKADPANALAPVMEGMGLENIYGELELPKSNQRAKAMISNRFLSRYVRPLLKTRVGGFFKKVLLPLKRAFVGLGLARVSEDAGEKEQIEEVNREIAPILNGWLDELEKYVRVPERWRMTVDEVTTSEVKKLQSELGETFKTPQVFRKQVIADEDFR